MWDELALSLVVRQWKKAAAKGIILFLSKLCFTVNQYDSATWVLHSAEIIVQLIIKTSKDTIDDLLMEFH